MDVAGEDTSFVLSFTTFHFTDFSFTEAQFIESDVTTFGQP